MAERLRRTAVFLNGRGLNVEASVLSLQSGEAVVADNCNRDTENAIQKRRGNKKLFSVPGTVVGIFNNESSSSAGQIHDHLFATSDCNLYRVSATEPDPVAIGGFYDPGTADFVTFDSVAESTYIATGVKRLTVYDGDKRWYAGITPPTVAPTHTTSGGDLTGSYALRYTYVYTTESGRKIESAPSPENTPDLVISLKKITWSWTPPPINNGERVSGYRLYRTNLDGSVTAAYFFLKEIDDIAITSFVDNVPDTSLLQALDAVPTVDLLPPEGSQFVKFYQNCLFLMGFPDAPHRIVYSDLGQYERFPPNNFIDLPTSSVSKITGVELLKGTLTPFLEDQIWNITGTDPLTFVARQMTNLIGCVAPQSLQPVGYALAFLWRTGFYTWDGTTPNLLSMNIRPQIVGNTISNLRSAVSVLYRRMNHYYCAVPFPDGVIRWWVLDYSAQTQQIQDVSAPSEQQAWFRYTGRNNKMSAISMARTFSLTDRIEEILWADSEGNVYRHDVGNTDDGELIDFDYKTYTYPDEADRESASSRSISISYRHWMLATDTWEDPITVGWGWYSSPYAKGGTLFKTYTISPAGENGQRRTRINLHGQGFGGLLTSVVHSGANPFRILGSEYFWRYNPRGLRGGVRG